MSRAGSPRRERRSPPVLSPQASRIAWRRLCERTIAAADPGDPPEADTVTLLRELAEALAATPAAAPLAAGDARAVWFKAFREAVAVWRACPSPAVRAAFRRGLAAQAADVLAVLHELAAAEAMAAGSRQFARDWD